MRKKFPENPIILVGCYNMDLSETQDAMSHWPTPMVVLPNEGLKPTHIRGRAIDHTSILGMPSRSDVPLAQVLDDYDSSDHFPVVANIPELVMPLQAAPRRRN